MDDNVVKLPSPEMPRIFGPKRIGHDLIIDGRLVPKFHIHKHGIHVEFVLDGRFSYEFPEEWAYLAGAMAANAMAIGAGYAFLGAETQERPFASQVMRIDMPEPA